LASETFDLVICSEILEHVPDLHSVLAELSRVTRPSGRLYATMPNDLRDVWPPLRRLCRKIDQREGHLRRMSRQEFIEALEAHGFRTYRWHYRGFLASAIWYSAFVYRNSVNERGHAMLDSPGVGSSILRTAAFAGMRGYMALDRLFSRYRGSMGIDIAAVREA
jgi:SAM-dependent methyltransferase